MVDENTQRSPQRQASAMRWLGRTILEPGALPRFAWQGSGFSVRVRGSRVALRLRNDGGDVVLFQSVVDGVPGARLRVFGDAAQEVLLAEGLTPGEHVIELTRDTEGQFGATTFHGFTAGEPVGPTPAATRHIEAVGDSITAGYGNLGHEEHLGDETTLACPWSAEASSWYSTYAAIAGRALGAEVSTLARSGWGVLPQRMPEPNDGVPSFYRSALGTRARPEWSFRDHVDAVVVNLGTNDWWDGDPGERFVSAYVAFLADVRALRPDAWLFLTIGSMFAQPELGQVERRLEEVVVRLRSRGEQRVSSFGLGTQDSQVTGCDWHPSRSDHERMAAILERELRSKLGW